MADSDDAPTDTDSSASTTADPKELYRQALEAKKNKSGYGSQAQASGNKSGSGSTAKAGGKREFRRKSG